MLAANSALSFGRIGHPGIDDINRTRLSNGATVAFLCALHRFQAYHINTLVRHRVSAQLSAESLVASYVERSQRQHNIKRGLIFGQSTGCLVGLISRLLVGPSRVTANDDTRPVPQTLWLYNYLPLGISAEPEWQRYTFLDQPSAERHLGGLTFPPSSEEWNMFLGSVAWSGDNDAVTFVERPYIFYPAGGDDIIWDLLRHGGMLRALERKMSRQRGEFGRLKGGHGETILGKTLAAKLPSAAHLKHDVTIYGEAGRQPRMQIDHGFVLGEVLVLVETKAQTLNPGYFLADDSFEKRVRERVTEKWVNERDQKLARFSRQVAHEWRSERPSVAICVICNTEVEYITSRQAMHWLDIQREIPRVCTPDELLTWLDTVDAGKLRSHPAAVSLTERLDAKT